MKVATDKNEIFVRHHRTLAEAFPTGPEYAAAIERTRRFDASGIIIVAGVCGVVAALAVLGHIFGGLWAGLGA